MTKPFQISCSKFQGGKQTNRYLQLATWNLNLGIRHGLTLIEVILALAILGIGLTVLISTASKCLAVVKQSRNYETARHLLALVELDFRNKVLELEPGQDLEDGSGDVSFSEFPSYEGKWEITTEGDEKNGLKKVVFRVSWSERGANPCEEVTTYLFVSPKKEGGTVVGQ